MLKTYLKALGARSHWAIKKRRFMSCNARIMPLSLHKSARCGFLLWTTRARAGRILTAFGQQIMPDTKKITLFNAAPRACSRAWWAGHIVDAIVAAERVGASRFGLKFVIPVGDDSRNGIGALQATSGCFSRNLICPFKAPVTQWNRASSLLLKAFSFNTVSD